MADTVTGGTTRRRAPYQVGDDINGIFYKKGTCLAEGTVTGCTWDQDAQWWRVTALIDGEERRYNGVGSDGESDYCSPGKIYSCRYRHDIPCRPGCPHSDEAREHIIGLREQAAELGYQTRERPVPGRPLERGLTLLGHGQEFTIAYTWRALTGRFHHTRGTHGGRVIPAASDPVKLRFLLDLYAPDTPHGR